MQAIIKKISVFLSVALLVGAVWGDRAAAQSDGETEAASESHLLQVMLPANAQRVLPQSVPAEITQTLNQVTAAGNGKVRQGDSEVLVWAGAGYRKSNAPAIINRLTASLKTAGWQYSVEGEENGITIFMALKTSPRRGIVGFYGATDDALILAATEILPGDGSAPNNQLQADSVEEVPRPVGRQNSGRGSSNILGTWTNGTVSMLGEKYQNGTVAARNGTTFKYVFHANGSFEFIGMAASTMYGCTTTLFQDKRGTYEVNGSQITLTLSKNFWRNLYSCAPNSNKERNYTLGTETYEFRTKTDEYGKTLICLSDGKGESCYRRED